MARIGVIAVQGAFIEHEDALQRALTMHGPGKADDAPDVDVVEVRRPAQAERCDGFVLPGGESTTIHKLLVSSGLRETLVERVEDGAPLLATCAGAILAASRGDDQVARTGTRLLGLLHAEVDRNAFGRQKDSFEQHLDIEALGDEPFPGVFIRAPRFTDAWGRARPWAALPDGQVVGLEQDHILALSFHPELSNDARVHRYFVDKVVNGA